MNILLQYNKNDRNRNNLKVQQSIRYRNYGKTTYIEVLSQALNIVQKNITPLGHVQIFRMISNLQTYMHMNYKYYINI